MPTGLKEEDVVCVSLHELIDLNPIDQPHFSSLLHAVYENDFEPGRAMVVPQDLFPLWLAAHG